MRLYKKGSQNNGYANKSVEIKTKAFVKLN